MLHKAEMVVVEAKPTGAKPIAPCSQHVRTEPLRQGQSIFNANRPVPTLLLLATQAITVHRQRHPHRLKRPNHWMNGGGTSVGGMALSSSSRRHSNAP